MADDKKSSHSFRKLSLDSFKNDYSLNEGNKNFYSNVTSDESISNDDHHSTQNPSSKVETVFHSNKRNAELSSETISKASKVGQPRVLQRTACHARSQSDGCQNIHLVSAHQLAAHSKHSHKLSLNCDNHGSSVSPKMDKFMDMSHSRDPIISDNLDSSTFLNDDSLLYSERNNESEEKDGNGKPLCESRFPRPRPGESLISFLSSADLYQNYGPLERENAHFYISEALMAAFEQMRFETECRALGLLSDSGDDSDEEIKCLQKEIRRRKLEKLDRQQTSESKNETSILRPSNIPTQYASTTDYSVYESPLSSTHTESSDPEHLTPHEQGVRVKSASSAVIVRPRRKAMKRSHTRSLGRSGLNNPCYSSGYSGQYDTSADESNIEVCDSMPSTCIVSNVNDVVQDDTDSTSLVSNDGSSDNKTVLGLEDATERENSGAKNEGSPSTQTETDPLPSSEVVAETEGNYVKEGSDLNTIKPLYYGFHARNSSLDLPPHLPDHRTAEGIGLRLLQHLGSPQRQLPKASDLQWLVSERDAPQELLPLPTRGLATKEQVLLRGTSDWAPPREQLILSLVKTKKRGRALEDQKYRCAGCGQHVLPGLSKHYRLCHYFMRYFCATCHMNQTHVIPAKADDVLLQLLHLWDGKPYPVSCLAHQLLSRLTTEPLFYPSAINPSLYSPNTPFNQFRLYRLQLIYCLPYIYSCSRAARESRLARSLCPAHWRSDCEVVTLQELLSIKLGTGLARTPKGLQPADGDSVLQTIQYITTQCLDHVSHCQACQGRGFICEVCKDDTPIFPFELATVRVCAECSACTHYRCIPTQCSRCKIRKEKKMRNARLGHTDIAKRSSEAHAFCDKNKNSLGDTGKVDNENFRSLEGNNIDNRDLQGAKVSGDNKNVERIGNVCGSQKESVLLLKETMPSSAEISKEGDDGSKLSLGFGAGRNEDSTGNDGASRKPSTFNESFNSPSTDFSSGNFCEKNETPQNPILKGNNSKPGDNLVTQPSSGNNFTSCSSLVCVEKTTTAAAFTGTVDIASSGSTEPGEPSTELEGTCSAESASVHKRQHRQQSVDSEAGITSEVFSKSADADAKEEITPTGITKGVGTLRPFMTLQNTLYRSKRSKKQKERTSVFYASCSS
ncbi:putative zinc-RING and/or ribbon [Trinorchestia longiramus]|nr:putative zinc-RING and/or ribbon [Trinorchestia longiramus]